MFIGWTLGNTLYTKYTFAYAKTIFIIYKVTMSLRVYRYLTERYKELKKIRTI